MTQTSLTYAGKTDDEIRAELRRRFGQAPVPTTLSPESQARRDRVAPAGSATAVALLASAAQLRFLSTLLAERVSVNGFNVRVAQRISSGTLTKVDASKAITFLKAQDKVGTEAPTTVATPTTAAPVATVEVTEGYWLVGESVYKVTTSRSSGKLYASKLLPPAEGDSKGAWEYTPGALYTIRQGGVELTLEAASKLGQVHGYCCRCGRRLDKPSSIEAGIGPVCATKF